MPTKPPLPVRVLLSTTFDTAFDMLHDASCQLACSEDHDVRFGQGWVQMVLAADDDMQLHALREYAGYLNDHDHAAAACAWNMLACVPEAPESYAVVLPNAQAYLSSETLDADADPARVKCATDAMAIWWQAAAGQYKDWSGTTFSLVQDKLRKAHSATTDDSLWNRKALQAKVDAAAAPRTIAGPSVVVMKREPGAKLTPDNAAYKSLMFPMPLVVAKSVATVRGQLLAEFPHAAAAIELLTRDLRDGQPVRTKPALLVGPAGSGKSLLARRFAEVLGLGVYRFDAASSADSMFGGIARSWSTSMPSVPARAVLQTSTGNPVAFVDELDKAAGTSNHNGSLWNSLMPFLERETSARYRDPSLEAELDLSWVVHLATANDEKPLPGPLKDRYRLIRMPAPTLRHLPALAANVIAAIARENDVDVDMYGELQDDELSNIGKAWAARGYSIRALQKIVGATLDARDASNAYAPRH
jgi:ATP-dependent Lon protease